MSLLVTAGRRGDSPQFAAVLEGIRVPRTGPGRPRVRPPRLRGDKAYSSRANRAYLRKRGIRCTIPEPADQAGNRKRRGGLVGGPRPSTARTTRPGTRPRTGSTGSSATGRWHTVRRTRGLLRGHRPGSRDRRIAVTCRCRRSRMPC
ncbi:transposase [Streptomyces sp. SM5]|uniref:transposase n=1 Tax=Streptomyces TaxID=1883 RepID=UPI0035BBBDC1